MFLPAWISRERGRMVILTGLALVCLLGLSGAQFGGMPGQMTGPAAQAVRSDVKYIRCEVCHHLAKSAFRMSNAYKKEVAERAKKHERKFKEIDLLEKIEKLTDPIKEEGEWITRLDLVEEGDKLNVKEQDGPGKCGTECKTIQKAALGIIEDIDTDVAEKLWQGSMSRSQFTNWLCKEASTACKSKAPKLPQSRSPGPAFEPVDPEELKMQRMMATMKEMGMGGQMFDRQQAQQFAQNAKEEDFDDYDDDDGGAPVGAHGGPDGAVGGQSSDTPPGPLDIAKESLGSAYNSAKDIGSSLLGKAQGWLGGKTESPQEL